jgi:hypothetical protein
VVWPFSTSVTLSAGICQIPAVFVAEPSGPTLNIGSWK